MDEGAIERAQERIRQRADAEAVDAVLGRARARLETLVVAAEAAAASLPLRVEDAVQEGLREQVVPVGRNLAEIRGSMNQLIRRLDALEDATVAERHARVDDLALLVDLISSSWQGADARLARLEASLERLEKGLEERSAIVYRIEDRRPDAANGP